jgi:hypothetical protein
MEMALILLDGIGRLNMTRKGHGHSYFSLFCLSLLLLFVFACSNNQEVELALGKRYEITHAGMGHEVHISDPAVAVGQDGRILVSWIAQEAESNNLYIANPGGGEERFIRINPEGMEVDSIHQAPGIAIGPGGEVFVTWSSKKPKPEGVLFASDLYISRSLDGGRTFDNHLRVNEDRPISHSFEGIDAASDGTLFVSWIDSRDGWNKAGTYLAEVVEQGSKVKGIKKLDDNTCVCCRVDIATGRQKEVAALWRKEFPDNVRDMVLAVSHGDSFASPALVHDDHWQMNACPHRGGTLGIDDKGHILVSWYTEGREGKPNLLFGVTSDGKNFTRQKRLDESAASIPDHVRMAVNQSGQAAIVWQDSTAVRRRILLRYTGDGGKTFSPIQVLSQAIKAYAPDIAVSPTGTFVVVWNEEQFPAIKTIAQTVRLVRKGK